MTWTTAKRLEGDNQNVWKYVFENGTAVAEAVLYRYPTFEERTVICCSTQSGCPVGCRFCGSGDYFNRSLTADEIIGQIEHVLRDHDIDTGSCKKLQFMFMSMGEPLLNWNAMREALPRLHAAYENAALLISTMGPEVPATTWTELREVSRAISTVGLQFSVHSPSDAERGKLIPFKRKLYLTEIAREGERWWKSTKRQPFFNYCATVENTSDVDADRLAELFDPKVWQCTVSVVCEREEHVAAANHRQKGLAQDFMTKMLNRGFGVRMFDPAGQDDIGGGCGQLWATQEWMRTHEDLARPSAGKGLPILHTPR